MDLNDQLISLTKNSVFSGTFGVISCICSALLATIGIKTAIFAKSFQDKAVEAIKGKIVI